MTIRTRLRWLRRKFRAIGNFRLIGFPDHWTRCNVPGRMNHTGLGKLWSDFDRWRYNRKKLRSPVMLPSETVLKVRYDHKGNCRGVECTACQQIVPVNLANPPEKCPVCGRKAVQIGTK